MSAATPAEASAGYRNLHRLHHIVLAVRLPASRSISNFKGFGSLQNSDCQLVPVRKRFQKPISTENRTKTDASTASTASATFATGATAASAGTAFATVAAPYDALNRFKSNGLDRHRVKPSPAYAEVKVSPATIRNRRKNMQI